MNDRLRARFFHAFGVVFVTAIATGIIAAIGYHLGLWWLWRIAFALSAVLASAGALIVLAGMALAAKGAVTAGATSIPAIAKRVNEYLDRTR